METKRKALGKGLEQLFSNERIDFDSFEKEIVTKTKPGDIIEINLAEIRSNPYQPRKNFDEKALIELADSIKEHGVVQPIIVKQSIKGYELVAGERRVKASKLAGLEKIPAIIRNFDDQEMMEIALVENIQRENLNPIEEAGAFEAIIASTGMTQDELAKKFGKSRSHITNMIGLLRLSNNTKKMIAENKISMGHARVLSKMADEFQAEALANRIIAENLSVRDVEKLAGDNEFSKTNKINRVKSPNIRYNIFENVMREKIGTKVKIGSHKIEIPFDSEKDLERIIEILGINIEG